MTPETRRDFLLSLLGDYPLYDGELHEEMPHEYWMTAALRLAEYAAEQGEVPVGCIIVRRNSILTADCNGRETFKNAAYHAETAAISHACGLLHGWRLTECTLYVTLEPCPMCAGAIVNARVPAVVIGAKDAKAGALGSLLNFNSYPLNHKPAVTFGVLENECRAVMQTFFAGRRQKNTGRKQP